LTTIPSNEPRTFPSKENGAAKRLGIALKRSE
jgi:hypothetical protein